MFNRLHGAQRWAPLFVPRETSVRLVRQFEVEAKQRFAKFVEAEHMLLALATEPENEAGRLLYESGLSHARIDSALLEERRRSLAFVGVEALAENQTEATELDSPLSLGTSAKAAIKRGLFASRDSRPHRPHLQGTDLLLGILQAELGTVPRALAIAEFDRDALILRIRIPGRQRC
jgi:ATP-dependent Clp protease ATP-binding subunit ClpA